MWFETHSESLSTPDTDGRPAIAAAYDILCGLHPHNLKRGNAPYDTGNDRLCQKGFSPF